MLYLLIFAATLFLAYSNGANDNFKGVATLYGSGALSYRQAVYLSTGATLAGALAALLLAGALVKNFSGKGLVPDALLQQPAFAIAVAGGAALTVLLATRIGMPVSTTHGLVGALVGAGLIAVGEQLNLDKLGKSFFLPLLASPLLSAAAAFLVYSGARRFTTEESSPGPVANSVHILSGGAVCFARALNDAPKIVGLLVLIQALDLRLGFVAVGLAMALGGWLNSQKIAETMSRKITPLTHGQGLTANLITSLLVSTASISGLPVSTTHVSVGSLFGIAAANRKVDAKVFRNILLSWVLTLPIAAAASAVLYFLLSQLQ
ncbi:inorganic phosphate transporter [Hymenobacter saemangeumensis]|uniref:Inorganic phosphate transporter n=1 Tax=Hymenobacter saemangeumensis TaxID=1084522 RepID=A0ABP8I541_9BACT